MSSPGQMLKFAPYVLISFELPSNISLSGHETNNGEISMGFYGLLSFF